MVKTPLELFAIQYNITEEALSQEQYDSAFFVACSIFFSEAPIKITYDPNEKTIDDLKVQYGDFEILKEEDLLEINKKSLKVMPSDYETFKLPSIYHQDFLMVCEYVILQTTLKNLNMLKNLGIDEMVAQLPIQLVELKQQLRQKYDTEIGFSVA